MDSSPSTLSGMLKQQAATNPDQTAISSPGAAGEHQDLTVASLERLVDAVACRLLSLGIRRGDVVPIIFGNTIESFVMVLAVIRCRSVAVPLHPALAQEEFEFYLSFYDAMLLLTGPGPGDQPAARAATARRLPHAVVTIDFTSGTVEVSSLDIPSIPGHLRVPSSAAVDAAVDIADVVVKPWDQALVLQIPGAMSSGYALSLTQKQLASCAKEGTDLVNLLRELGSSLAGVRPLFQDQSTLETLISAVPAAGSLEASSDTGTGGGVDRDLEKSRSEEMVGVGADESDLKLKDVLSLSAGAVIAVLSTTLSHKYGPEAAAERAGIPLLFLYGAVTSALMGQVLKVLVVGRFHGFFKAVAVLLFYSGTAVLAVSLLHPGYSHAALAVTVAAAVASLFFLLKRVPWGLPPASLAPPPHKGAPEAPVLKHGHWLTKCLPFKLSSPPAGINTQESASRRGHVHV